MIKFYKAMRPSRRREKNKRFILQVGKYMFHMSETEATILAAALCNVLEGGSAESHGPGCPKVTVRVR